MNPNLPKPVFDALARQTLPTDHPSADVLNAFAENVLAGDEYRRTAVHLARCSECREIVFLTVGAEDRSLQVEDRSLQVEELVAAAATRTRRRWMPRLVWGASMAAVVLVAAGVLILRQTRSVSVHTEMAATSVGVPETQPPSQAQESQPATAPQTTIEVAAARPIEKTQTKTARAKTVSPSGAEALGVGSSAGILGGALPTPAKPAPATAVTVAKAAPTNAESRSISIGNSATMMAPATPAPHMNSFAAVEGGPAGAAPGSASAILMNPQATMRSVRTTHPQWRIMPDGHLEHLSAEGWTQVLANRTATFRVVSVVGSHVWVGGSGGALFHSHDDGQNWQEVALSNPNGRETATIVSIQFDDPQHGTVTTDTGTHCVTTDGGGSWSCSSAQE